MTLNPPLPPPRVLATDLDGTLIPLPGNPSHVEALTALSRLRCAHDVVLVYATGRHLESVLGAMADHHLPRPDWIVCDVGTSIHHCDDTRCEPSARYARHLTERTGDLPREAIEALLVDVDGLNLQQPDHQRRFKVSYECSSEELDRLLGEVQARLRDAHVPYEATGSIDPFLHCGLLDVLPRGVSKAYALSWLSTHADFTPEQVIYAGDSGNDLAALVSGFRAIIVANGSPGLAEQVAAAHRDQGFRDRLYIASGSATRGVLEGCRHFGLVPESAT